MSGPAPAPLYMSDEVISGGTPASKTIFFYPVSLDRIWLVV
jgi:hypothetical protein